MNVLRAVAQELGCFVLGIDHFGKNLEAGTRGASSKEASGDVVLACLGDKQLSGSVTNTRLAVRKHRGGKQGQEYPFQLRMVEAPEKDEDGDPITTLVVDWLPRAAAEPPSKSDIWAQPRRQDQRTAVLPSGSGSFGMPNSSEHSTGLNRNSLSRSGRLVRLLTSG